MTKIEINWRDHTNGYDSDDNAIIDGDYPYQVMLTPTILNLLKIACTDATYIKRLISDNAVGGVFSEEEFNKLKELVDKYNHDIDFTDKFKGLIDE